MISTQFLHNAYFYVFITLQFNHLENIDGSFESLPLRQFCANSHKQLYTLTPRNTSLLAKSLNHFSVCSCLYLFLKTTQFLHNFCTVYRLDHLHPIKPHDGL